MTKQSDVLIRQKWIVPVPCLVLFTCVTTLSLLGAPPPLNDASSKESVPLLVTVELPRLKVREYHRPYVAVWIEDGSRKLVKHVSVWYQQGANAEGHGEKWLPDMRQWWRRGGRKMDSSVDAVSGATRGVGKHLIRLTNKDLSELKPGKYNIVVEAAREVGGRELVRVPFSWPPKKSEQVQLSGKTELGQVSIQITPPGVQ
ncbi:DUF2271 domain-containing protein [Thalassoglobus polymorphus]|uniref:DUF2271 domain-containing protein n=1 Tax=Thalassoglobus polymorphus TaxID=2527994 RepID=A0A517QN99_9PLAN|nr:DUF2271 domain-containing protein [Thalassoglobus polymorphus]QDT33111.1 hypothetical protein Mal48_23630 [Thalassoglobus polymorphus]